MEDLFILTYYVDSQINGIILNSLESCFEAIEIIDSLVAHSGKFLILNKTTKKILFHNGKLSQKEQFEYAQKIIDTFNAKCENCLLSASNLASKDICKRCNIKLNLGKKVDHL